MIEISDVEFGYAQGDFRLQIAHLEVATFSVEGLCKLQARLGETLRVPCQDAETLV